MVIASLSFGQFGRKFKIGRNHGNNRHLITLIIPSIRFQKMKTIAFFSLRIILGFLFFNLFAVSLALDEEGCLTCHQYPGLVRLDETGELKVLHIDEARYLSSAHGQVACKQCHTTVNKVPHTGETRVDCTTNCHLEDEDQEIVGNYPLDRFHITEQFFIAHLEDEGSCRACHPLYPHSEDHLVRALLNLHTGFMRCEVCHLRKENYPDFTYDWRDSENAVFGGQPFGTYYNPKTKRADKSTHFISRIAVFVKDDGKRQLVFNSEDTHKATEYMLQENTLKPDQKEKHLNYFHRDIAKKEVSVACDECHSSHTILDFRQLGFDEKKTQYLISLNIKGLVTKYKTFYFPDLFGH